MEAEPWKRKQSIQGVSHCNTKTVQVRYHQKHSQQLDMPLPKPLLGLWCAHALPIRVRIACYRHNYSNMAKKDAAVKKAAAAAQSAVGKKPESEARKSLFSVASLLSEVAGAVNTTYNHYCTSLTPRLRLIDTFLVFLVALGVLQFVYVLLVGNFPFNAFLGGFISCVGQFVLTVSLRMQYVARAAETGAGAGEPEAGAPALAETEKAGVAEHKPERGFAEFVFASVILHFLVFHFIN